MLFSPLYVSLMFIYFCVSVVLLLNHSLLFLYTVLWRLHGNITVITWRYMTLSWHLYVFLDLNPHPNTHLAYVLALATLRWCHILFSAWLPAVVFNRSLDTKLEQVYLYYTADIVIVYNIKRRSTSMCQELYFILLFRSICIFFIVKLF